MPISECCGAQPDAVYYWDYDDGICSDCHEHTGFIDLCCMCGSESIHEGKGDDAMCLPCILES